MTAILAAATISSETIGLLLVLIGLLLAVFNDVRIGLVLAIVGILLLIL